MTTSIFIWPPDWSGKFRITYGMQTVISQNERYKEQRASLRDVAARTLEFTGVEFENSGILFNVLLKSIREAIYVPVFSEPMFADVVGELPNVTAFKLKIEGQGFNSWALAAQKALALNLPTENSGFLCDMTYDLSDVSVSVNTSEDEPPPVGSGLMAETTVFFPLVLCYLDEGFSKYCEGGATSFDLKFTEAV